MPNLYVVVLFYCSVVTCVAANYCFTNHHGWSGWSACSVTCGGGSRSRRCVHDNAIDRDLCNPTCLNRGQFYDHRCHCPPGTSVPCCTDHPDCASGPCKNGGSCHEHINGYTCTCPAGTLQPNCDDILECGSQPCQNGGTCHEYINYYTCDCVPGTTGHNCVDIPDCANGPCLNGGNCIEEVGGYSCLCPAGTTRHDCQDIPECLSNPCQNGGTCNEMINMYNCTCTPRFAGYNCEKSLFSPHDQECRSEAGGSCYIVFQATDTWQGAQDFCTARNGHLVVPDDLSEELFLETYMRSMSVRYSEGIFWIGGKQDGSAGPRWVTGSRSSVYRWPSGVSGGMTGNQCLALDDSYSFLWQAFPCDRKTHFVCEETVPYTAPDKPVG